MTLSCGSAIFTIIAVFISLFLPKERLAVHTIVISVLLILLKIALIIAIFIMEIHVIIRIIVIIISAILIVLWGGILWLSIACLKTLSSAKKD